MRVLNASGSSFHKPMVVLIVGSKLRHFSKAERRAIFDEVVFDTISRNFKRNFRRALIASRDCELSLPISVSTISNASLRSLMNSDTSTSSNNDKDDVFVATS